MGLWIALAAVIIAVGFGLYRRRTDGTFRANSVGPAGRVANDAPLAGRVASASERIETPAPAPKTAATHFAEVPDFSLGERATLVQFSSAFCTPCRATRLVLTEVVGLVPGVRHVEIDAEQHLDLVRTLNVMRTPTTLILNANGEEISRAAGAPKRDAVLATLEKVV